MPRYQRVWRSVEVLAEVCTGQATFFSELFGTSVRYNTAAVGVYVAIAFAITVVAVLVAKETRNSALRHDRVVREAHR